MFTGLLLVFLLWFDAAPAPPGCLEETVRLRGAAVAQARAQLTALHLSEGESLVPQDVQTRIEALKDRLQEFVIAAAACSGRVAPFTLQRRLAEFGDAAEDPRDFPTRWRDMHGASLSYEVSVPPNQPSLLAVVARFAINCGEDALFLLFEQRGQALVPIMIRRSDPYDEISGAWETLQFAVSRGDARVSWYVAISRSPPWCQSVWRSLTYDLARPGPRLSRPDIFFTRTVGHNIDSYRPVVLRAGADRFQVEHDAGILDVLINRRRHVETYSIDGNAVRRIQPVAFNVRDFVDEWIGSPWAEARHWSSPSAALSEAHRRLASRDGLHGPLEFGPIRRCRPGVHEVRLDLPVHHVTLDLYLTVSGDGEYRLERVSRTPSGGCRGPDLRARIERESRRRMGFEPTS